MSLYLLYFLKTWNFFCNIWILKIILALELFPLACLYYGWQRWPWIETWKTGPTLQVLMLSTPAKITKRKWISIVSDMPFHSCFSGRIPKKTSNQVQTSPNLMLMRKISIVHTHLCQIRHMWNIYTTFELDVSQYVPLRNFVSVPIVILPPPSCPDSQADPRRTLRSRLYWENLSWVEGSPSWPSHWT